MTKGMMSAGDFAILCNSWTDRSFIFSSDDQPSGGMTDLRVRFSEAAATLCPNRVVFRNDSGDSLTVRGVKRARIDRSGLPGVDRIELFSDDFPGTMCVVLSVKISKTH